MPSIEYSGKRIEYCIERKKIKHVNLRITAEGAVKVSAPRLVSNAFIQAFVEEKADWIWRRLKQKEQLLCVRGNCDTEVDQMVLDFPTLADYAVLPVGERLIYATHGHHFNRQTPPPLQRGDILLHGHTHIPDWTPFGTENLCLNPGSVSIPKADSAHSYMTLKNGVFRWHDLMTGECYHTLNLSEMQAFLR